VLVDHENLTGGLLTNVYDNLPGYIFGNLARLLLALALQPDGIFQAKSVDYFEVKFRHSRILPNARKLSGTASSLITGGDADDPSKNCHSLARDPIKNCQKPTPTGPQAGRCWSKEKRRFQIKSSFVFASKPDTKD
jgi:hypothetical protein